MMYTTIDPEDREAVAWLQTSLSSRVDPKRLPRVRIGVFDSVTRKLVELYQLEYGLPKTGKADTATLQHLQQT